jgi:ribosome-associated protein
MESERLKSRIISILEEKKGGDIIAIDMAKRSSITDFFVIATGKNVNHVRALAEALEEKLEPEGIFVHRKEGLGDGRWAVLDYGDVIVHIFNADTRDYFCLEKLWK